MNESAQRYKQAESLVFQKWETEKDDHGRSQAWKVLAVKEDMASGRNTDIMKVFVEEMEKMIDKIEKIEGILPRVVELCKQVCSSSSNDNKVAVEPVIPH